MSEKEQSVSGSPDYQLGVHDIKRETTINGEFIEFDYETAAVFKRLADDIYESTEAGIREPLQNSITAIRRAYNQNLLPKDEGIIEITVKDGDQVNFSLRDNGVGISKSVLKEVLAVIGRSQNRDDGELSGKYGMGFLACYKLVGTDGGFIMHTNSRNTNNDPIKGIWKPGGFEIDENNKLPDRLGEDDYGTLFEFTLKEDVSISQVRNWVERHAEWSRIPILYEEYDTDGNIKYDDEFGDLTLPEFHNEHKSISIDTDYYTGVASENATGRTLLLNSPIDRNSQTNGVIIGWNYDIRLKNENGVVVSGPNKGLQPVGEAEYNDMSEERKESYITYDGLTDEDICLPEPTGTRDTLERNREFWTHLEKQFEEKYESKVQDVIENIDVDNYPELSLSDKQLLDDAIDRYDLLHDTNKKTKKQFKSEFDVDIDKELINLIETSRQKVWHVNVGADEIKASRKNSDVAPKKKVYLVDEITEDDVYMGATLDQLKMDVVWDDSENNSVVRVESQDKYDDLDDIFGWDLLKNVNKNIQSLDLSDEIKERLKDKKKGTKSNVKRKKNSQKELSERNLVVHKSNTTQTNWSVGELEDYYKDNPDEYLVLFPSNTEKKISNHMHMESRHVAVANCIVKVYDHLSELDNVYSIDDWHSFIHDLEFKTNVGDKSISECNSDGDVVIHTVSEDMVDVFREDVVLKEMETVVSDGNDHNNSYQSNLDDINMENVMYVPMTPQEVDMIRVLFSNPKSSGVYNLTGDINSNFGIRNNTVESDVYWYAWARLPRWRNTKEIQSLNKPKWVLTPDWVWLIDNLANSDYDVKSISGMNIEPPRKLLKFETNNGFMNLEDIVSKYSSVIIHVLPMETVDAFRSEAVSDDVLDYVLENARCRSGKITNLDYIEADECVYVPMTNVEINNVMNTLEEKDENYYGFEDSRESTSIMAVKGEYSERINCAPSSEINSDTAAYASACLSDEICDVAVPIDEHNKLTPLSNGGLEFIKTLNSSGI